MLSNFIHYYQLSILSNSIPYHVIELHPELHPLLSSLHTVQSNTLSCYRTSAVIINCPSCIIHYLTMLSNFVHYYQLFILSNPIPYHVIEIQPVLSFLHPVQSNTLSCYRLSSIIINSSSCPIQYLTMLSNTHPLLSTLHPVQFNTLLRYQIFNLHYQLSILSNPIPYHVIEIQPVLSFLHPVQSNTLSCYRLSTFIINSPSCIIH